MTFSAAPPVGATAASMHTTFPIMLRCPAESRHPARPAPEAHSELFQRTSLPRQRSAEAGSSAFKKPTAAAAPARPRSRRPRRITKMRFPPAPISNPKAYLCHGAAQASTCDLPKLGGAGDAGRDPRDGCGWQVPARRWPLWCGWRWRRRAFSVDRIRDHSRFMSPL
jgi:hypothetical protein